jgi:hypothetical protein
VPRVKINNDEPTRRGPWVGNGAKSHLRNGPSGMQGRILTERSEEKLHVRFEPCPGGVCEEDS